jgi:hypothetical protein
MESALLISCCLVVNTAAATGVLSQFNAFNALNRKKKYELVNRITGSMFQLYVCYRGFYIADTLHTFIYEVAGYMISEMVFMSLYSDSLVMYIHHIASLYFVYIHTQYPDEVIIRVATYIWMLESTAPLLSVCWILHLFKYPDTLVHKAIKMFAFLYWSVIRVGVFPYILYTSESAQVSLYGSSIVAMNVYWFTLLLKRVLGTAPALTFKSESRTLQ